MGIESIAALSLAVFFIALLYSSVGHAGASGYIAVMTLFSLAPETIKPVALVLNICVATIGTWQFCRAGFFSWRLFWPFAILSFPFAYLGGYLNLASHFFNLVVGVVLLFSAIRFVLPSPLETDAKVKAPAKPIALVVGASLGFLSGLTGTGGGIFLTPLLLIMHWATTKTAAAVSVVFILVNSISGLLGYITATNSVPLFVFPLVVLAILGGAMGSYLGSYKLQANRIKQLLAVVLTIAGIKLIVM